MSDSDKITSHFGSNKKEHTEIKHEILKRILLACLSIANQNKNKRFSNKKFTYIDLYSGRGVFLDGSYGSPLLALQEITNGVNGQNPKVRLSFDTIECVFIEKDKENIEILEGEIRKFKEANVQDKVKIYTGFGAWEDFELELKTMLKQSTWGFVFADPFSTELNTNQLNDLFSSLSSDKDILILFNINTLCRQLARNASNDHLRICKNMGQTPEELDATITILEGNNSHNIIKAIIDKGLPPFGKCFQVEATIPIDVKGQLRNSESFCLVFASDSIAVIDSFITAYKKVLFEHKQISNVGLFSPYGLSEKIKKIISTEGKINLKQLYQQLFGQMLLWKEITNEAEIPSVSNIIKVINDMSNKGEVSLTATVSDIFKANNTKELKITEMRTTYNVDKVTITFNKTSLF